MVLDNPAPNPTRDQTDVQTVEELENAVKNRAKIARALDRSDVFASAWMFPYAYHIKVIVRDGTAFWLSSGNLNNSNQPDLNAPPLTEDRDWHVIVEDEGLSKTFLSFLNQDYVSASQNQAEQVSSVRDAVTNKGFVVDSSIVVVSSQNFSPAGIEENRDAGVIIESPEVASYFEPIFLSDWDKAKPFVSKEAARLFARESTDTKATSKHRASSTTKARRQTSGRSAPRSRS
jgi:phosphatidylserine/phosphatidylglycerophosphate/cardiolipin synthase-like enzyme